MLFAGPDGLAALCSWIWGLPKDITGRTFNALERSNLAAWVPSPFHRRLAGLVAARLLGASAFEAKLVWFDLGSGGDVGLLRGL